MAHGVGTTAYHVGIVRTIRDWTARLEAAYRDGDPAAAETALAVLDRLGALGRLGLVTQEDRAA
ncbi:MAG: hypothetical protein WC580_09300 [Agrococcus sp.]